MLDADSINACGAPGVTERELGEAVTPLGSVPSVTDTDPAKPFCPATDTLMFWPVPPRASVTLAGDKDKVKLGVVGGGYVPPVPLPPPPHPATHTQKKPTTVSVNKIFGVIGDGMLAASLAEAKLAYKVVSFQVR